MYVYNLQCNNIHKMDVQFTKYKINRMSFPTLKRFLKENNSSQISERILDELSPHLSLSVAMTYQKTYPDLHGNCRL